MLPFTYPFPESKRSIEGAVIRFPNSNLIPKTGQNSGVGTKAQQALEAWLDKQIDTNSDKEETNGE